MPIRGVTEIVRLPRLGKIHLGIKVKSAGGKEIPRAVDYFVCTPEVQAIFGEKPKELRIMLPLDDEAVIAQQWYRCYSQTRGLICKGDGEMATQLTDLKTGAIATKDSDKTEMRESTCQGEECPQYKAKRCRRVMNLQFILPEVPGLGVWQLDTGSFFSIVNINSNLNLIRGICGRIKMIPLLLSLGPREVAPDGKKKIVHILNLTAPFSLAQLQERARLPAGQVMIPAPDTERPDLLFPDDGNGHEERVVDPEQAQRDIDELWDGVGEPPTDAAPPTEADPPPEPQQGAPGGNQEGDTSDRVKLLEALNKRWPGAPNTIAQWCNDTMGVNTVADIPEDRVPEALRKAIGK